MIAMFTVCYCIGIWLFFVKLKIKPNPANVAVAAVIGVVAIGAIVIFWRFAAPSANNLVVVRYTVQLVPQVKGPITKIHAEPNVPLKKGKDILFEIQKDIYENTVEQLTASMKAAKANVEKQEASVRVAKAGIRKTKATLAASKAELETAEGIQKTNPSAIADLKVTQVAEQLNSAIAAVEQASASEEQAEAGLASAKDTVASLEAQLANAQFNLKQCVVYAPSDGFVTNWQVREGTMAVPLPLAPVGTFVDTTRTNLVASFGQNVCKNVNAGDPVEIAFKSRPGEVFKGKVEMIVPASGEGQFVTTGQLGSASNVGSAGELAVRFQLNDQEVADELPMGTAGNVVIYTSWGKPFHIISKVVVRMNAWGYYLNPF